MPKAAANELVPLTLDAVKSLLRTIADPKSSAHVHDGSYALNGTVASFAAQALKDLLSSPLGEILATEIVVEVEAEARKSR